MAKIMIDAKKRTKDRKDGSGSWEEAQARICVFDENNEDSWFVLISDESFSSGSSMYPGQNVPSLSD